MATARAILDIDRILAKRRFIRNVFPVPPGASILIRPPSLFCTLVMMVS